MDQLDWQMSEAYHIWSQVLLHGENELIISIMLRNKQMFPVLMFLALVQDQNIMFKSILVNITDYESC